MNGTAPDHRLESNVSPLDGLAPLPASEFFISSWIPYENVSGPSLGGIGGGKRSEKNLKNLKPVLLCSGQIVSYR